MLARACLRGRNAAKDSLENAVASCVSERNGMAAIIDWRFTAKDARKNSTASTPAILDLTQY